MNLFHREKAEQALWFAETYGLTPRSIQFTDANFILLRAIQHVLCGPRWSGKGESKDDSLRYGPVLYFIGWVPWADTNTTRTTQNTHYWKLCKDTGQLMESYQNSRSGPRCSIASEAIAWRRNTKECKYYHNRMIRWTKPSWDGPDY